MHKPFINMQGALDLCMAFLLSKTASTFCLLGSSGFGKSKGFSTYLTQQGFNVVDILVSDLLDSISIFPNISEGISQVTVSDRIKYSLELANENPDKVTIIILEEFHLIFSRLVSTKKQAVVRQLLREKIIGSTVKVPNNVKFVLLGNTSEDSGQDEDESSLANMLTNNIAFFELKRPSIPEWLYAKQQWGSTIHWNKPLLESITHMGGTFPATVTPRKLEDVSHILNLITAQYKNSPQEKFSNMIKPTLTSYFDTNVADVMLPYIISSLGASEEAIIEVLTDFKVNPTIGTLWRYSLDFISSGEQILDAIIRENLLLKPASLEELTAFAQAHSFTEDLETKLLSIFSTPTYMEFGKL